MSHVTVYFWGRISDQFGKSQDIAIEGMTYISDLRQSFGGELLNPSVRAVLNDQIIADDAPIGSGDKVEFLSPVGGG